MDTGKRNYLYVYDEEHHQIIVIDGETGEKVEEKDDQVTSILKFLRDKSEKQKLRKFAVWCSHRMNDEIKPIQNKLIELAEKAIQGEATEDQLRELYNETEGAAVATDTIGLRQGSAKAPAFLATRECINPDAFEAAMQAARFHRLWAEIKDGKKNDENASEFLREIRASTASSRIKGIEQQQIDYLLDLMGEEGDKI